MIFSKAQISVFEMIFVILLFSSGIFYMSYIKQPVDVDYMVQLDSSFDVLYYNDTYRDIIMAEDLSSAALSENWSPVSDFLDKIFSDYELIVSNSTHSNKIFSCTEEYYKEYSQRIVAIDSAGSSFEVRYVLLGVCH